MHSNLLLATTAAVVTFTYVFKSKKPKTELEEKSVPVPCPQHYLPFQIDLVLDDLMTRAKGGDDMERLYDIVSKYGMTLNLRTGGLDNYLVTEPSSVQHVLAKRQPNYEKGPEFNEIFHDFLGSGIFNADGETWKTQRQIARPHFQTSEFKDVALINKHADQLIK
ncbi:hypothetical protein BGW38_005145, partial [Lunasporangiospora selenospora]